MNNALTITDQYPVEKFNLLVSMRTVAEISEIQKPVMNVVYISTNLDDKEIYEQEKGYGNNPPKYALTKKALTKLMRAAGIKIVSSKPLIPTTCQKCAQINASIGKPVNCGGCPNKDVKYESRVSVPQLTGENIEIVAHKEIFVNDVTAGMSDKQKAEFIKFRNEMCESKALNRALRIAMQIKATYTLEELKKPFVVAYLVPNLDNAEVKEKAIDSFFAAKNDLYGGDSKPARTILYADDEADEITEGEYEDRDFSAPAIPQEAPAPIAPATPTTQPAPAQSRPVKSNPNICAVCGKQISNGVSNYSIENFGQPMCMDCQRKQ